MEGSTVELAKNRLILGQIYSTLLYSPSLSLNPNGPLRILEGRERWVCGELLGEGWVLRERMRRRRDWWRPWKENDAERERERELDEGEESRVLTKL